MKKDVAYIKSMNLWFESIELGIKAKERTIENDSLLIKHHQIEIKELKRSIKYDEKLISLDTQRLQKGKADLENYLSSFKK